MVVKLIGRCGIAAVVAIAKGIAAIVRGIFRGFQWFCKGIGKLLFMPINAEILTAKAVQAEWQRFKQRSGISKKCRTFGKMMTTLLLSEHGILVTIYKIAVPLTCLGFLWAVVAYGSSLEYGVAVHNDTELLGVVADEAEYDAAMDIVWERLSYTKKDYGDLHFFHTFSLTRCNEQEMLMTPAELANKLLQCAEIELCEATGIYVQTQFLGAVSDAKPVEAALVANLSHYSEQLSGEVTSVAYENPVRYERGIYPADALVATDTLIRQLTSVKRQVKYYSPSDNDTIYSVAARYSVTPEDIQRMNPELGDSGVLPTGKLLRVQTEKRFLPIVHTVKVPALAFIDFRTLHQETTSLAKGVEEVSVKGRRGEKEQVLQITYTDGRETARDVVSARRVMEPVDEQILVGTFEAQPYSTVTVVDGNGHFFWPVNGGRITSLFGGDRAHRGLDIAAMEETEIYAADGGVVVTSGWNDSYGNYMVIDHEDGYRTLYAHCYQLIAALGETVQRGEVIALVGTTGHSTGPHLHFEVYVNGVNEDPAMYLRVNAG